MGWIDSEALWFWPKTNIQLGSEIPRPITPRERRAVFQEFGAHYVLTGVICCMLLMS